MFFLPILILICGILILIILMRQRHSFGILSNTHVYSDTVENPGEILESKTLNLRGKPDYIIEKDGEVFPVEVKTGKTPPSPYLNHTMQLIAYCYLVEETYGKRPVGGYIRYPNREFPIAYTDEAKTSLVILINEINELKEKNIEPSCPHPEHN